MFTFSVHCGRAEYVHYEARHTRPLALTPDGRHLLALNSTDARMSVFNVENQANPTPILIAEIPVGLEPVSIAVRNNDEVWVVNELSDSISIVSLSARSTVASIYTPDEPADVVFAGGKAFVSCSRDSLIRVLDATTHVELTQIELEGVMPRALLADELNGQVYAAFLFSGNNTTILPEGDAPTQPDPTNTELPTPPKVGLLVADTDARIGYDVLDHDIAVIDIETLTVDDYFEGVGANIFNLALDPFGDLWASNTEAHNLIRFESAVNGIFAQNRVTRINRANGEADVFDLNPWMDGPVATDEDLATSLAQPDAMLALSTGLWVAAFGSDRLARLSYDGEVETIVDLRPVGEDSAHMRGPRGLVYQSTTGRIFVYNKLSGSIISVDATTGAILGETPAGSHDPLPETIAAGRGFLFDARLSGNGTVSCATCHIDADRDGLAWDLGDPNGEMVTVLGADLSLHDPTLYERSLHPMKGPMMTQTLRGIKGQAPFHWRGDKPTLQSFNSNYEKLMAGEEISDEAIDALAAYIESIGLHPNPNQNLDRSLKTELNGGNAVRGEELYLPHDNHCIVCHILPTGTDNNLDIPSLVGLRQFMKNPTLRAVYQKQDFTPEDETTVSGYGLGHDGSRFSMPRGHPYVLDVLTEEDFPDMTAYVLSFDTGTAPTVGYQRVVDSGNLDTEALSDIALLEARSGVGDCDLIVRGAWGGKPRGFLYDPTADNYQSDVGAQLLSRTELLAGREPGDYLTFLGVPPGQGARFSLDRDEDAVADGEADAPIGQLQVTEAGAVVQLDKPALSNDWFWEYNPGLSGAWLPVLSPQETDGDTTSQTDERSGAAMFYRLRRTW
ncbi:cytochrome c peroxidase [Cerasicoccus frondis]|uniref:cytochrome c peroxidase n=1 Tax=Cerasicoccus frondis TaxID=490090 RepID=UPI002852C105|nr:cytochrome c peroxidase [Cerasicoccus frondis]